NRCLNALRSARRRPPMTWSNPNVDPPEPSGLGEVVWLEPYPDALLDPEAQYERTEAISLAYITALQLLPARQRAVLILRDVLGYHAAEVAKMLDATLDAVNSALKRARATLQQQSAPADVRAPAPNADSPEERALVTKFVRAYESGQIESLVDL